MAETFAFTFDLSPQERRDGWRRPWPWSNLADWTEIAGMALLGLAVAVGGGLALASHHTPRWQALAALIGGTTLFIGLILAFLIAFVIDAVDTAAPLHVSVGAAGVSAAVGDRAPVEHAWPRLKTVDLIDRGVVLKFRHGPSLWVPDRVFDSPSQCHAFVEYANGLLRSRDRASGLPAAHAPRVVTIPSGTWQCGIVHYARAWGRPLLTLVDPHDPRNRMVVQLSHDETDLSDERRLPWPVTRCTGIGPTTTTSSGAFNIPIQALPRQSP